MLREKFENASFEIFAEKFESCKPENATLNKGNVAKLLECSESRVHELMHEPIENEVYHFNDINYYAMAKFAEKRYLSLSENEAQTYIEKFLQNDYETLFTVKTKKVLQKIEVGDIVNNKKILQIMGTVLLVEENGETKMIKRNQL